MAREVELKFEIDPADAAKVMAMPKLAGPPQVERQVSVYYDTPKSKLRRHGFILRVRQHDAGWTQTVKRTGDGGGLFDRDEWEEQVQSLQPDLQAVAATPLVDLIKPRQFRQLVPVFRTDVERSSWQLGEDGGIEVSHDSGAIEAGERREPIHELELELKHGEAGALFAAARTIARRIPLRLGVQSKAERGFALARGKAKRPAKASPVELDGTITVAEGLAIIVAACLRHFRLNEPLLVAGRNAEALHQLRVAIRRLRTALWLFRPAVKGKEFDRISDQLRSFTRDLGAARNTDVILASMRAQDPARGQLEKDRRQLYDRILRKLDSARFHRFILDLVAWTHAGEWRTARKAAKPMMPFVVKRLDRLWRRIADRGSNFTHLSDTDRHELRIDIKKIRYALEFLREPFALAGNLRDQFGEAAEGLQDSLGRLNDLATRKQLLSRPAKGSAAARHPRSARQCLHDLERIGPFWRKFAS